MVLALAIPLATVVSDPTPTPVMEARAMGCATGPGTTGPAHPAVNTKRPIDAVVLTPLRYPTAILRPPITVSYREPQEARSTDLNRPAPGRRGHMMASVAADMTFELGR